MEQTRRRKFLVFGNEILKDDSLPLRLLGRLGRRFPEIDFRAFDPNENLEAEGRSLDIIDTAEGISEATLITDIDLIKTARVYSMHDFDLGYSLKLLKKIGYVDSVRIFAVPKGMGEEDAFRQLAALISSNLS